MDEETEIREYIKAHNIQHIILENKIELLSDAVFLFNERLKERKRRPERKKRNVVR